MPDSQLLWSGLFGAGVALAIVALFRGWQGARLLRSGTRAVGTISRYTVEEHRQWQGEGRGSEDVRLDFPHVAFTLPDGTAVEFRSRLQHMFGPQRLVGSEARSCTTSAIQRAPPRSREGAPGSPSCSASCRRRSSRSPCCTSRRAAKAGSASPEPPRRAC